MIITRMFQLRSLAWAALGNALGRSLPDRCQRNVLRLPTAGDGPFPSGSPTRAAFEEGEAERLVCRTL